MDLGTLIIIIIIVIIFFNNKLSNATHIQQCKLIFGLPVNIDKANKLATIADITLLEYELSSSSRFGQLFWKLQNGVETLPEISAV